MSEGICGSMGRSMSGGNKRSQKMSENKRDRSRRAKAFTAGSTRHKYDECTF
jgi:hypothetical protein